MKPGLKILITGITLFILGGFVVPLLFVLPLALNSEKNHPFLIPGSKEVKVEKPGRYYVWNDHKTIYEGKSYNRLESIPDDLEFLIRSEGGTTLSFTGDTSRSSTSGEASRNTIGYVDVSEPGILTISVSGNSEKRVFSFSRSGFAEQFFFLVLFGGMASTLVAFSGLGLMIWGIVKLATHPNGNK